MVDVASQAGAGDLAHEPPVPGWRPRPPDALLRRSRLESYRRGRLERLRREHPRWHARVVALQAWHRRLWDRLLPRSRVLAVTVVVLALTVFDAVATSVVVGTGVAEEANPLLADLIEDVGLAVAMVVRVAVGSLFTLILAWLSTWRREARPVLALVAVLLAAIAALHVAGIVWAFG